MLLLIAASLAQAAPAPADPPIVVIGPQIDLLADAVAACARDGCSVPDDVAASIRYANALFAAGRYGDAMAVLGRGVSRVEDRVAEAPGDVSRLYGAQSLVAKHFGDQRIERRAAASSAAVLREHGGAPADRFQAELRLIDAMDRPGEALATENAYAALAERAAAAGEVDIAAAARLRQAVLLDGRGSGRRAERLVRETMALPGLGEQSQTSARLLLARWAELRGDDSAMAALSAEPGSSAETSGIALSQPATPRAEDPARDQVAAFGFDTLTRSTDIARIGWADVAILIAADGAVSGVEVVRRGGADGGWLDPVVDGIRERRYPALAAEAESASGPRRILERYTLTADFDTPKGSLIRRRLTNRRIERIVVPDS